MMRKRICALFCLAACSSMPDTNPDAVAALVEEGRVPIERRPDLVAEPIDTKLPEQVDEYRIGRNDVLYVAVVGHPEFSSPTSGPGAEVLGTRVQKDGKLYLPRLEGVEAAGRTVPEVRKALTEALRRFVKEPQVAVEILRYESQKFYVLGHVHAPSVLPVDGDTTLLEAIARAGGIRDTGDIEGAYVIRRGQLLPVSLGDLLLRGDTTRNVYMRDGDLVYVPDKADWSVYVLGEVRQPGVVPMGARGLMLSEALAAVGGIDPLHADRAKIRIFRGGWQRPKAYTISTEDVYRFGTSVRLRPGDRLIVAPRGLATYNRTVTLMLPFLQSAATAAAVGVALSD